MNATEQKQDPILLYLKEKHFPDAKMEDLQAHFYSHKNEYEAALDESYLEFFKDQFDNAAAHREAYYNKYGNPFASKKKVESELPSQGGSESLAPDPQMDFPMPETNQSFADLQQGAEPRSVLEQQVGATLEGATISFDHPTVTSSTASKVQKAREERGFGERLLEAGKYGLSKLVTMTSKIPGFIDEINYGGRLMENINKRGIEKRLMEQFDAGKLTEDEVIKARKQAYDKNPFITNKLKDGILDAVEKNALVESLDKFEKDYEEYQADMSQSITQSLKEGNFKEAGMQTAVSVVESLPITLAAAFTGGTGLGLISMGTAAEKSADLEEEAPDMPESAQKLNAILTGFSEGMSELVTLGIGKQTMKAFIKESGEEAVKEAVSNTVKKGLLETAGKVASKTYVEEGLSEFGNTIAQNTIDWVTGKDEEANIMEGAWDALIVGGASGKLFGLAQDFANVKNKVQQKRADKKSDQIIEKSKDLTKQIIRRREKLDDSVVPAADQLVEYAAENGITDMTDAWEQFLNEQTEDMKESLIREGNGDDIIRIAETKAVVNESIQDTEETQQDEAQSGQAEAESQTQEEVQEQQVEEEAEPTVAQEQPSQKLADVSEATSPSNTQELINEIKEKGDPVQKELASMVETLGAVDNIETTNDNLGQVDSRKGLGKAETSGRYGSKIAKVALDDQAIEEFADEHGLDAGELRQHAATHEMTHAITMQAIHASRKIRDQRKKGMSFKEIAKDMSKQTGANITEGDVKAIATLEDDIDALRVKVSNELGKGNISLPTEDDRMGLRGTMDFIAETFSNPKFRNELAKVKVLDKVIDAIKKFIKKFGGDKLLKAAGAKKGTALESAIEQGFRAMDFYAKLNADKISSYNDSELNALFRSEDSLYERQQRKQEREYERQQRKQEREYERQQRKQEREYEGGGSNKPVSADKKIGKERSVNKSNINKNKKTYFDEIVDEIKSNGTPAQRAFLDAFLKVGADKNMDISESRVQQGSLGQTQPSPIEFNFFSNVVIDEAQIESGAKTVGIKVGDAKRHVVIHEMVHALTTKILELSNKDFYNLRRMGYSDAQIASQVNNRLGSKLTETDIKLIDETNNKIQEYYDIAVNNKDIILSGEKQNTVTHISYGLTNIDEFVAELFSNPVFRNALNKIQYKDSNIFEKVIKAISNFVNKVLRSDLKSKLGGSSGSLLEAAANEAAALVDIYQKLNQHQIDTVNNIRRSDTISDADKYDAISSYMALSGKRPLKIINTEKYVANKINTIPDHQIVENVVDAFGVSETDAIEIIENIAQRPFRPNMNTIVAAGRTETAKIFFWVRSQIKKIGRRKKSDDDTSPYLSAFDELVRLNIQDKWIGLKRYQESIQKLYGENIDDELNAYILREQANSVTADYEMRTFEKILGKKAGEIGYRKAKKGGLLYQALKDGVTWGDMNEFLYMRHAIDFNNRVNDRRAKNYQRAQDKLVELNNELANIDKDASPTAYKDIQNRIKEVDRLAKKYQPLSVPASGVTNQEAEQRLREIRRDNPQVEVHADRIRSYLFGEYIENLRKYKLLSNERIDALENGTAKDSDVVFKNYVPLKVKSEKFESEFEMDSPGLGSIYDFGLFKLEGSEKNFGPEDRHDALSVMMTLAVKSKRTGEINNSLRAYAGLIKQYGSQEATVVDGMVINKTNSLGDVIPGSVRDFSGKVANAKAKITYINEKGKHSYIIFKSEQNPTYLGLKHFPRRYSKMGGTIQQAAAKVNNVRRALITQWNPKFAFSNMIRDTQDAFFNTLSEQQLKNAKIKFVKNLAKAHKYMNIDRVFNMSGSGVNISNDPTLKTFQDAWINMQMHGGAMSWGKYTHSFEEEVADIDKRVAEIEEGLSGGKKARAAAMNALNRLAAFSDGIENATRLAAYVTAMEMEASPQSAAAVSRDISLNFQRKGLYTSNLNLWYLFLNAGIQGAERGLRSVRKFGWGKSFTLLTGLAFANRMMMHYLFVGDDEEKKKQVEALIYDPYVSANKSIFAAPWMDKPVMFNKPYSFMRVFFGLGEGIADLIYEYKTPLDIASDLGANILTAIDPIGGSTGSLTAFVPSEVLRLGAQVGFNEQWNGSPILYSMAAEDNTLLKEKYSKNTNKSWVAAAEILYDNTGADWIAPAYMEYIMDKEINVGVLKEGAGMIDEFVKAYGGEEGKRLTEMAEQLMINIAKLKDEDGELLEVESKKFNKYRAYPTVKLFYSPRDPEKVMLGNFINILYKGASFANTPAGGLSTGEMNYLKEGYDLVRREELLNPSMLSRRMNNMIEKFPDEDWGWYDSAKSYWD